MNECVLARLCARLGLVAMRSESGYSFLEDECNRHLLEIGLFEKETRAYLGHQRMQKKKEIIISLAVI